MTLKTLEHEVAKIKVGFPANRAYVLLVEKSPPHEIRDPTEHRKYSTLVKMLIKILNSEPNANTATGIRQYLQVLAPFITKYEQERWPRGHTSGRDILAFLLEQNDLLQEDLKEEIGPQPYVSDIIKGKKSLTSEHIQKLSKRFGVSPAVFYPL